MLGIISEFMEINSKPLNGLPKQLYVDNTVNKVEEKVGPAAPHIGDDLTAFFPIHTNHPVTKEQNHHKIRSNLQLEGRKSLNYIIGYSRLPSLTEENHQVADDLNLFYIRSKRRSL